MENKYLNFDGMATDVANDMPWSDTVWSNQAGNITKEEAVRVSQVFGTALNASGEETITLDHHMGNRPNMVLSDIDNSKMPDSDVWSNHPGFLGITWSKKKAESERESKEQAKVNASYPNTGNCAVLTSSLDRLDSDLERLNADSGSGSKGAKRVNKRAIKTRDIRRGSVKDGMEASCAGEEAAFQRDVASQQQVLQSAGAGVVDSALSPMNLIIGLVVIGGLGFAVYKLAKR